MMEWGSDERSPCLLFRSLCRDQFLLSASMYNAMIATITQAAATATSMTESSSSSSPVSGTEGVGGCGTGSSSSSQEEESMKTTCTAIFPSLRFPSTSMVNDPVPAAMPTSTPLTKYLYA